MPDSFAPQSVGAVLALTAVAEELGIAGLIDGVCPVRSGAAPVGPPLLLAAIHRVLAPRHDHGMCNLLGWYEGSAMVELFPGLGPALDNRRMCEMLGGLTNKQVDEIEAAVVHQLIEVEGVNTTALAFDCTNFDSYAGAKSRSRLLQRGHGKSGKTLRAMAGPPGDRR